MVRSIVLVVSHVRNDSLSISWKVEGASSMHELAKDTGLVRRYRETAGIQSIRV